MKGTVSAVSHPIGMMVAVASFTMTAPYQIFVGRQIANMGISAPQLLLNQAVVAVLIVLITAVFVDTVPDFGKWPPAKTYP